MTLPPYIDTEPFNVAAWANPEAEAKLDAARAAYTMTIDATLDQLTLEFDDPIMKQVVVQDLALFTLYLVSTKMVLINGGPPWRKRLLSALQHLTKRAEKEVPEMLITLARAVNGGRANEDGGTIQ
jgi:hypothetical protein